MSDTLDINGAAALMQVHVNTAAKLIKDGVIPAGRIGRAYVLMKRDVLAYIELEIVRQTGERMGAPTKRRVRK